MSLSSFLEGCLTLDLEISADGRVREIGAVRGGEELLIRNAARSSDALQQLDKFIRGARFIVGHNLVAHDRPFIEAHLPGAEILDLPVVDTLYLAPLARPQRPYHPLVKDYKLVGGERSDPVSDCELALELLKDCWAILERREREQAGLVSIYRTCFHDSDAPGGSSPLKLNGTGQLLQALGARMLPPERVLTPTLEDYNEAEAVSAYWATPPGARRPNAAAGTRTTGLRAFCARQGLPARANCRRCSPTR